MDRNDSGENNSTGSLEQNSHSQSKISNATNEPIDPQPSSNMNRNNLRENNSNGPPARKSRLCDLCYRPFVNSKQLRTHMYKHIVDEKQETRAIPSRMRPFTCFMCKKCFSKLEIRKHSICSVCHKCVTEWSDGEKQFTCLACKKLERHIPRRKLRYLKKRRCLAEVMPEPLGQPAAQVDSQRQVSQDISNPMHLHNVEEELGCERLGQSESSTLSVELVNRESQSQKSQSRSDSLYPCSIAQVKSNSHERIAQRMRKSSAQVGSERQMSQNFSNPFYPHSVGEEVGSEQLRQILLNVSELSAHSIEQVNSERQSQISQNMRNLSHSHHTLQANSKTQRQIVQRMRKSSHPYSMNDGHVLDYQCLRTSMFQSGGMSRLPNPTRSLLSRKEILQSRALPYSGSNLFSSSSWSQSVGSYAGEMPKQQ